MAEQKQWVVTLSNERPAGDIRKALEAAGFEVDQVMDEIGVVTGRSDEAAAKKLRDLPGVADVAGDHAIDIGPPDSDPTW